jgi:hypothetical protein
MAPGELARHDVATCLILPKTEELPVGIGTAAGPQWRGTDLLEIAVVDSPARFAALH